MSHELRTPLNAIIGFSEIMEQGLFGPLGNPQYREYSEDIRRSASHLLSIISDILDLSKIEAGRMELQEEMIDVAYVRSEEHTSELQSLMRISYAVVCLKKKT